MQMVRDVRHRALLRFIKKILDVPAGYSKDDLVMFRSISSQQYRSLTPIIEEYLRLAERSDTEVEPMLSMRSETSARDSGTMHLFDMLREKKLFPANSDLSDFAERILPNMSRNRFDKMSRSDIAARIIEYLETLDSRTRKELESSMRSAMKAGPKRAADRKSFLSTWERIIKGIEL
jgi:hypothetical protein